MSITPEYTKRAIANYQSKFDRVNINLQKGIKEEIKKRGFSVNGLVNDLLSNWVEEQRKKEK